MAVSNAMDFVAIVIGFFSSSMESFLLSADYVAQYRIQSSGRLDINFDLIVITVVIVNT